jgi:hypothetical protein
MLNVSFPSSCQLRSRIQCGPMSQLALGRTQKQAREAVLDPVIAQGRLERRGGGGRRRRGLRFWRPR